MGTLGDLARWGIRLLFSEKKAIRQRDLETYRLTLKNNHLYRKNKRLLHELQNLKAWGGELFEQCRDFLNSQKQPVTSKTYAKRYDDPPDMLVNNPQKRKPVTLTGRNTVTLTDDSEKPTGEEKTLPLKLKFDDEKEKESLAKLVPRAEVVK